MQTTIIIGLALTLWALPLAAHAELPGQPCTAEQVGTTKMADDRQNIIACLETGNTKPGANKHEWKAMTAGGEDFKNTSLEGGLYTVNFYADGACRYPNPLTGRCSCPSGFAASVSFEFYNGGCDNGYYADNGKYTINCGVVQYQCVNSKKAVYQDFARKTPSFRAGM